MADAVVSLVDVEAGVALEPRAATVLTEECRYAPRVSAVAVDSPIVFRNADGVMHNVHAHRDGETVWDFALPDLGSTEQRVLEEAGALRIVCDVHAWMEAWVHAFPHPYFAVSDAEGRFRITDVPPGQYVVRVWHESWRVLGTRSGRPERPSAVVLSRTVSVSGRQETTVDFELGEHAAELAGE
ncbi:MAG: carboxypeptidase regulatory-like domain-containing protein [Sandaracinaceae bacterium]|nr:carboxypeptidase regulatory-like domain-containing protein [Sandaracinaceae bacterium]